MKLIKNRIFMAAVCIITAFLLVVLGIRAADAQNQTINVLSVANTIRKGDVIEEDNLTTVTVGKKGFPKEYTIKTADVVGQYALADFYPGDFILKSKVSNVLANSDAKLLKLDGKKVAISVLLKDFARGVSDKIVGGDIVSCVITTETDTNIPQELSYLEVVATTSQDGIDKDNTSDSTKENLATATLLATPKQAILLANANLNADIHLVLVYRGDDEKAKEFLSLQDEILEKVEQPSQILPVK